MDKKTVPDLKENPRVGANIFSVVTFWWMNGFFKKKNAGKTLENKDLYQILKTDTASHICARLEKEWIAEQKKKALVNKPPSLERALWKTFRWQWLALGIPTLMEEALRVFSPFCIRGLLRYFEGHGTIEEAYFYAGMIALIAFILTLTHHILFYHLQQLGWHIRIATCSLMYKKTLVIGQNALGDTSTGQIVNLASTDVVRYDLVTIFLHYVWVGPLQAIAVSYLVWLQVGYSAFFGLAVLMVTTSMQSFVGRQFGKIRSKMALITDKRIRMMNEIITSMRVIKMYTWENSFHQVISKLRKEEVYQLLKAASLRAYNFGMIFIAVKLIAMAVFIPFVLMGGHLSASLVFTTLGLFEVLRTTMGIFFPASVERLSECRISTKRIQDFLVLCEIKYPDGKTSNLPHSENPMVKLENVTCLWNCEEKTSYALKNISFQVDHGHLIGVVGSTGAGKSSLLVAILRELAVSSGSLTVKGRISYASQVPWLFYGTVRENIIFGEEYDADKYQKVVTACSLLADFKEFDNGDETEIGERGITLSGGQKARVNLARAVYRNNSDIFLLDDPLSALDAKVARRVFDDCICGLLANKIRILVTHQVSFLNDVDNIAVLKEGELIAFGKYDEIFTESRLDLKVLELDLKDSRKEEEEEEEHSIPKFTKVAPFADGAEVVIKTPEVADNEELNATENISLIPQKNGDIIKKIDDGEGKSAGVVTKRVYWKYLGWNRPFLAVVLLLAVFNHGSILWTDWWLSYWATESGEFYSHLDDDIKRRNSTTTTTTAATPTSTSANTTTLNSTTLNSTTTIATTTISTTSAPLPVFDDSFYMNIFIITNICAFGAMLLRSIAQFQYSVRSGRNLHDQMFHSILATSVRFFDTNPVGRVLNRFSNDLGLVDDLLPGTLMDFTYLSTYAFMVIIVACIVNYITLFVVLPLGVAFWLLRKYYVNRSRDVKRLEGMNRSPVFSHLSNTLDGITTVRAYNMEKVFEERFYTLSDVHSSSWYMFLVSSRWFGQRLDLMCVLFVSSVSCLSVFVSAGHSNPGSIGLAISYSLSLIGMFQWCVRQSTEVENLMTSVERIQEYADLKPELEAADKRDPPEDWPHEGAVKFDDLCFAHYDGGPDVLRNLSFSVEGREKIGVIGRTGAGKSSLISAMYRLHEFTSGDILIDGVSISKLDLKVLRSALSIIPQDPRLFYGTIRFNMDPFSVYTDDELWASLEKVQLKERVTKYKLKLDTMVNEGGSNISIGERQLFCLSRAILRKTKIVVIDEATANVDQETDRLIQQALRVSSEFCTVITIAHRLNTIIDCDKVLVMDFGRAVEFGEPHLLIQKSLKDENDISYFYSLVQSYSETEAKNLINGAEQAYNDRHGVDDKKNN